MLFALTSLVDCLAVLALAWLASRVERRHVTAMAEQQAVLERLRAGLADLLADAERRGSALDDRLAAREKGLRELLGPAALARREAERGGDVDPAEQRLARDLERVLGAAAAEGA